MTGEVGSGKTTVCRHVAANLHPGLHRVGYVSLTTGNVLDLSKKTPSKKTAFSLRPFYCSFRTAMAPGPSPCPLTGRGVGAPSLFT